MSGDRVHISTVRRQEFITVCMSLKQSLWVTDFFFIVRVLWLSCFYSTLSLSELRELVMDREAWRAVIHGVAENRTQLSDWSDLIWSLLLLLLSSLQSCPTLCDPIDGSPPGSPVPGIPQARILEWVAISFSNAWKWKVKGKSLSNLLDCSHL